jgi:phosphoenolpyruvate carboxylase
LLERNPSLARSIMLRNPYVDPMSFLQVELLRRAGCGDERFERPLLLTLNGTRRECGTPDERRRAG